MTHRRIALLLAGASLLLVSPFLITFSRGVEKSIFSAMATLTDVKETLDEKLILLSDIYLSLDSLPPEQRAGKLEEAEKHYKYAQEVYTLSSSFIAASSKRYPRYGTFWERYRKRLGTTWREINATRDKISRTAAKVGAGSAPLKVEPQVAAAPEACVDCASDAGDTAVKVGGNCVGKGGKSSLSGAATIGIKPGRRASSSASVRPGRRASASALPSAAVEKTRRQSAPAGGDYAAQAKAPVRPKARVVKRRLGQRDILERYREGYQYFAKGGGENLEKAAVAFREILDTQPAFHLARYWLAKTYLLQNKVALAQDEAKNLLQAQPNLQIAKDLAREVKMVSQIASVGPAKSTAPVRRAATPVRKAATPVRRAATPVRRAAAPVRKAAAPVRRAATPVRRAATPVRRAATPVRKAAAPVRKAAAPVRRAATPVRRAATPVRKAAAPVRRAATPVRRAATPVRKAAAPVRKAAVRAKSISSNDRYRPIACMVENSKYSRPQSGLSFADIVVEMPVEGGITRFMAIYRDPERQVSAIGPVRSARHYFVQQVPAFDALYAHCGASTLGYIELKKAQVDDIDEIRFGHGFYREKTRKAPHNLYTSLASLKKAFALRGYRLASRKPVEFMPVLDGMDRSYDPSYVDLEVRYHRKYTVKYTYDPLQNKYYRFINDEPHIEALNGSQITADNVLVMTADSKVIDKMGRLDIDLESGGQGQLHRGGKVIPGTWCRGGRYGALTFRDMAGQTVMLNPGRTWIQYVPPRGSIQVARRPLPKPLWGRLAGLRRQAGDRCYALARKRRESPMGVAPRGAMTMLKRKVGARQKKPAAVKLSTATNVPEDRAGPASNRKLSQLKVSALPKAKLSRLGVGPDGNVPPELAPLPAPAALSEAKYQLSRATRASGGEVDVIDFDLDAF